MIWADFWWLKKIIDSPFLPLEHEFKGLCRNQINFNRFEINTFANLDLGLFSPKMHF